MVIQILTFREQVRASPHGNSQSFPTLRAVAPLDPCVGSNNKSLIADPLFQVVDLDKSLIFDSLDDIAIGGP